MPDAFVGFAGERLSMVIVALSVSVPAWVLVPVQSVIVLVTVNVCPGMPGISVWLFGVIRILYVPVAVLTDIAVSKTIVKLFAVGFVVDP